MIRQVAVSFLGPKKIEGGRKSINKMFEAVLYHFMQSKGIYDYKTISIEFVKSTPTENIGVYLHKGIAEVEFQLEQK